jgi:DNA-binding NarL/FixJ family response regulator
MNIEDRIRVMVADDQAVVREGLSAILARQPDMLLVADAVSGFEAIEKHRRHRPHVMLMDLRLSDQNGLEAMKTIREESPMSHILVLTAFDGDEDIYRALEAGASGYLLKDVSATELVDAVRIVSSGRRYVPDRIARRLAERVTYSALTDRELEVLRLIVAGNSNKEIAWLLRVTEGTIKGHVNNLLGKMGAKDRTHAAISALRRGIIHLNRDFERVA